MGVCLRLGTIYFTQAFTQTQKHLHGLTDFAPEATVETAGDDVYPDLCVGL